MRAFADAICAADLMPPMDLEPEPELRHYVRHDAENQGVAVCGASVNEPVHADDVTCPACLTWLDEFERLVI